MTGFLVGLLVGLLVGGGLAAALLRRKSAVADIDDLPLGEKRILRPEPVEEVTDTPAPLVPPADRAPWRPVGALGPGSADPLPDGGAPHADFTLKADTGEMTYWTPDHPAFAAARAEIWFDSETTARSFGFEPATA